MQHRSLKDENRVQAINEEKSAIEKNRHGNYLQAIGYKANGMKMGL